MIHRSRFRLGLGVSTFALLGLGAPALAQTTPTAEPATPTPQAAAAAPVDDEAYEVEELVVTPGRAQVGAVVGDIPPEIQLSPRDIRAYGVSDVSELITALSPQTASGRGDGGRPVILVNGQRVSGFNEVRDIPTEAIQRVDILPEEVSLKYGYRADQRVINLVLRPRFRAVTVEGAVKTPTQGDGAVVDGKANLLRIQRERRVMVDAKASSTQQILESERDIANTNGDSAYRTLQPESESITLTAVVAQPIREGISASFNASLDASRNDSLLGLPQGVSVDPTSPFYLADANALGRKTESTAAHLGGTVNGAIKGWSWTVTANADHGDTFTTTDREVSGLAYTDKSRTITDAADAELVVNGVLAELAAAPVSTTFKAGVSTSQFDTRSRRAGVTREGDLSRDTGSFQANLDVPLASRTRDVRPFFGDLSGNLNVAVDELSDFGTLTTLGYGLNWSPAKAVRIIASVTEEENAPTVQQLGAPEQATPGVRVFDFLTGETVEVTRIEGGAPGLDADHRKVMKLGLTLKPFDETDVTFTANWVRTETRDVIAAFPTATREIEAAFPDRFVRDASGRLVQIDSRPVNFDRRETEELRYGFTWRKPLGPTRPPGGWRVQGQDQGPGPAPGQGPGQASDGRPQGQPVDGPPPDAPRPEGGDRRAGGGFGGGFGGPGGPGGPGGFGGGRFGGGPRGGNLQLGLYHTLKLEDEIVIRPGVPVLDLLGGSAIGNSGGQPRHQVDLQANASKNGLGLSLNARWQSATTVRGSSAGDLKFDDLTTVNLRLFADLGAQPWARQKYPWLRGSRVSLSVDNLFDQRQQVRTATGETPVTFQPDYLDPLGRQVRLSFRKLFF